MDETRKRIVLVDDHALFRNGLKGLIDGRNGCCVVGEFSDGADFVKALPSMDADAVFAVVFGADGGDRCFLGCAASAVFGAAFAGSEGLLLVPES